MKVAVLDLQGKKSGETELPQQFSEEYREDVIRRAFLAEKSHYYQPKGAMPLAGLQTTADYYGRRHAWRQIINTGRSRLPREKITGGNTGRVLRVPSAVKGRRAHPPKPQKILVEKINLKERNYAMRSALAACCDVKLVQGRGHAFEGSGQLPLVVDDSLESVKRVKEAKEVAAKLGLENDLKRAKAGKKMRSGKSRLRKGGYRVPKSVLVVLGDDKGAGKAFRNLPGVDVCKVSDLSAELLAPGGQAGRLAVFTKSAVDKIGKEGLWA